MDRPVTPEARPSRFSPRASLSLLLQPPVRGIAVAHRKGRRLLRLTLPDLRVFWLQVRARELYMMKEIYANGPIMACIFDYDNWNDFFNQCALPPPIKSLIDNPQSYFPQCPRFLKVLLELGAGTARCSDAGDRRRLTLPGTPSASITTRRGRYRRAATA